MAVRRQKEHIPGPELREYLKLPVDPTLSKAGEEVRILPDGRVLWKLVALRSARTWPSREAYLEFCRECEEEIARARSAPSPAQTLLPPIEDFLRDVEAHAKSLGSRLRIPDAVLDRSRPSLDAVDKALKRIPWSKRQVPDIVTPLVAYVGEVLRTRWDGRWARFPATQRRQVRHFDTPEMVPWAEAARSLSHAAATAGPEEREWVQRMIREHMPEPRLDVIDEPICGHENEPIVLGKGRQLHPFTIVYLPMVDPSQRIPLRSAVSIDPGVESDPAPPVPMMVNLALPGSE